MGKYTVNLESFERLALPALELPEDPAGAAAGPRLVVIDEAREGACAMGERRWRVAVGAVCRCASFAGSGCVRHDEPAVVPPLALQPSQAPSSG